MTKVKAQTSKATGQASGVRTMSAALSVTACVSVLVAVVMVSLRAGTGAEGLRLPSLQASPTLRIDYHDAGRASTKPRCINRAWRPGPRAAAQARAASLNPLLLRHPGRPGVSVASVPSVANVAAPRAGPTGREGRWDSASQERSPALCPLLAARRCLLPVPRSVPPGRSRTRDRVRPGCVRSRRSLLLNRRLDKARIGISPSCSRSKQKETDSWLPDAPQSRVQRTGC